MNNNTFTESFKNVIDFRQEWKVKHKLIDIIFIAVVATIAGADKWIDVADFAEDKEEFLKQYISLENGIPSHDTFERVFENLESEVFNKSFISWAQTLSNNSKGRIIAIDGKTSRRSHDNEINKKAIHIVNAWVDENDLILGQLKTEEKSNEITAIPELLDLLFIKDSIITIDSMGTQKKIVKKIIEKKADYVLALKGNHKTFSNEVREYFEDAIINEFKGIKVSKKTTREKGHGRIEKREYYQTGDIKWFTEKHLWEKFTSIGMVRRTVVIKEKTTVEIFYYISSLMTPEDGECDLFAKAVRNHWGVESCHWVLDVVFREDDSRVRKNNGAINQSMVKKIALNILKQEKVSEKNISLRRKRKKASRDDKFLERIINSI